MKAFTSRYIFDGKTLLENKAILVDQDIIVDIINKDSIVNTDILVNYGEGVITPGFIDLQLNGCGGILFNEDISDRSLEVMYQTCLRYGTTSFLPTLITSPFSDVKKALEVIKEWFKNYENTRGVIGIHLEGPFISCDKSGIHPKEYIIKPTQDLLNDIVEYTKYFPIKMTIAPEVFTLEQIKFLSDNNVILAIGHSNATYEGTVNGINSGIVTATHTFNAMSGFNGRNPGVIGAVLNKNIYAGVIADLLHVHSANIELLNKTKPNKIYLVTDSVTATGTNMVEFSLGGKILYVKDGKCVDKDGVLGGAFLTMNEAVKNVTKSCNIELENALNMASLIPAKVMKLNKLLGKIKQGYRADLMYLDLTSFACRICN